MLQPNKRSHHQIDTEEQTESKHIDRQIVEDLNGFVETRESTGRTEQEREREDTQKSITESQVVEGRMVFPFRVEVHQVAKIESISKRLKTGVSGGEHCNQQIQKQNKRDTEVNYQEQDSRKTLLSHVFEGEAAHSPGEEGEKRGIETTEEVVVVEEVDSNESEEEGHEQEDESNAKQVPEHVLDDGDEGTESGTYFDLLEHLHPNRSNEEAKENSSFE